MFFPRERTLHETTGYNPVMRTMHLGPFRWHWARRMTRSARRQLVIGRPRAAAETKRPWKSI
jgi:hypothetical protein